jgi:putative FmdB family regulatory protein
MTSVSVTQTMGTYAKICIGYNMPLYDFKCQCCNEVIEIDEPVPPPCSTCGNTMLRIWSAPAVHFKGSGFYSTGG